MRLARCISALAIGLASLGVTELSARAQESDHAPEPERAAPRQVESTRQEAGEPRLLLKQAIDLYIIGRYQEVVERLRPLVEAKILKDRADQCEALRAFGISLYLTGAIVGAERAFRDLLRIEPTSRMDPSFVRPEVVQFFEGVRKRYQEELDRTQRGAVKKIMMNFVPGLGQLQNGQRKKAALIFSGMALFGATSLVTGILLYSWKDETGQMSGHESAYRPVFYTNAVTFSLFLGFVAYGIVDGLIYYKKAAAPQTERIAQGFPGLTF